MDHTHWHGVNKESLPSSAQGTVSNQLQRTGERTSRLSTDRHCALPVTTSHISVLFLAT